MFSNTNNPLLNHLCILDVQLVSQVKKLNQNACIPYLMEILLVRELTNQGYYQDYLQNSPIQVQK